MPDYKRMYIMMFRAAEIAVRELEENKAPDRAILVLKLAQAACEEIYISAEPQ